MSEAKKASLLSRISKKVFGKGRWIALILLIAFIGVRGVDPYPVEFLRLKLFDFYQKTKPREVSIRPVTIIDLDEASLAEIGQWPWARTIVADMVNNLMQMGAAQVAFDIVFAEPDRMSPGVVANTIEDLDPEIQAKLAAMPSNDTVLAKAIKKGRVVLGQANYWEKIDKEEAKLMRSPIFVRGPKGISPHQFVPPVPALVRNVHELEKAAAGHGFFSLLPELDGVVRRVPTLFAYEKKLFASLSLEMLRVATNRSNVAVFVNDLGIQEVRVAKNVAFVDQVGFIKVPKGAKGISYIEGTGFVMVPKNAIGYAFVSDQLLMIPANEKELKFKDKSGKVQVAVIKDIEVKAFETLIEPKNITIPTDSKGRVWPYFSRSDPKKYVSALDVLSGTADPDLIKGRMMIVGTSAAGLLDIRSTPVDAIIPGVEVHAQVIETALGGEFLKRPSYMIGAEVSLLFIGSLLMIWLVPVVGAKWTLLLFSVIAGGSAGTSWYLFNTELMLFDVGFAIIAMLLLYTFLVYYGYTTEEKQREQVRGAFSQYLSPALVEQLAENPAQLALGGTMRDMTLLFCDVRGFTTISESFGDDAEGLTSLINTFLTPMTDDILARQGTIDKYMGDCIMAFWNAPLDDPDHARNGCVSALTMMDSVVEVNKHLKIEAEEVGRKYVPIKVGIGLNSGECCVGNMGSTQRFDYSVLGDNVNLAARLEGQSKGYGVDIVIGENTEKGVHDMAVLEMDLIKVKGKTDAVCIYTLQGDVDMAETPEFKALKERHDEFIKTYRAQGWDRARELMDECRELSDKANASMHGFYDIFLGRISDNEANPPAPDWDGVFVATTK
ncbi:MAG: CHASE2 domain-containing protein [Rhodospirillales bacterium]|nr:CHASE2 domain-containing protein [Rhodospirillales bacterium]